MTGVQRRRLLRRSPGAADPRGGGDRAAAGAGGGRPRVADRAAARTRLERPARLLAAGGRLARRPRTGTPARCWCPAPASAVYTWGRTVDEPIQPLAGAPWAMRTQVPLGSEGNTRVMDTVEEVLAGGRGSPGPRRLPGPQRLPVPVAAQRHRPLRGRTPRRSRCCGRRSPRSAGLTWRPSSGRNSRRPTSSRSPVDDGEQPPAGHRDLRGRRAGAAGPGRARRRTWRPSAAARSRCCRCSNRASIAADRPARARRRPRRRAGRRGGRRTVAGHRRPAPPGTQRRPGPRQPQPDAYRRRDAAAGPRRRWTSCPSPATSTRPPPTYQGIRAVSASTRGQLRRRARPAPTRPACRSRRSTATPATAWHSASVDGPVGQWLEVDARHPAPDPRGESAVRRRPAGRLDGHPLPDHHRPRLQSSTTCAGRGRHVRGARRAHHDGAGHRARRSPAARTTGNVGIHELSLPGVADAAARCGCPSRPGRRDRRARATRSPGAARPGRPATRRRHRRRAPSAATPAWPAPARSRTASTGCSARRGAPATG